MNLQTAKSELSNPPQASWSTLAIEALAILLAVSVALIFAG